MKTIDLNADLGEGGADDASLLELVTSANIACGGHAGNDDIMRRTIELATAAGVAIGAHPGYEDRENFGRREMQLPLEKVTDLVARQVEKLANFADGQLHHVKPHGALYNQANRDEPLAEAIIKGITKISPRLMLYAQPCSLLASAGQSAGLTLCLEGFADRRYLEDGTLMPRSKPGAVIADVEEAVNQARDFVRSGKVETLCVHGDGPTSLSMLKALRCALLADGFVPRAK